MKIKKLHITLILFVLWSFSYAQQFTNYTTTDGLPSNHVYTILQDTIGYMWFLTDKGMARYDGKTFKTFTTRDGLPNNDIWEAFTTPDGKVWYLLKSNRLGYIKKDRVYSFPNQNTGEIISPINAIQSKNKVYPSSPLKTFALKDSVWQELKFDKDRLSKFKDNGRRLIHDQVSFIQEALDENFIQLYDAKYRPLAKLSYKLRPYGSGVKGQIQDSLYFFTYPKGYMIVNLNTLSLKEYSFQEELGITIVEYPRINTVDDVLQITGNGFVGVLNKDLHIESPYFFPKHLDAHFGFIDRQNNIWLSTFNKGIFKLPATKKNIRYHFQNQKIQTLSYTNDQLYAGVFNKGYYRYQKKEKQFNLYQEEQAYLYGISTITSMNTRFTLSNENIWVEDKNGIKKINIPKEYDETYITDITAHRGSLYSIFTFGIHKVDPVSYYLQKDLNQRGCTDLHVYKDRLLVATTNGLKEIVDNVLVDIPFKNELFNKSILSITPVSENKLLLNTDGFGSFITDLVTIAPLSGSEYLIVQDAFAKAHEIWLATNAGVLQFLKKDTGYTLKKKYTVNNGLPSNDVNALYLDDEELIVGTNNGLAIVPITHPGPETTATLNTVIHQASYNNQPITAANQRFTYDINADNILKFKVAVINYNLDTKRTFTYKLSPIQNDWVTTTTDEIIFNNLSPDSYVFNVKSESAAQQLRFTVTPRWWQKKWIQYTGILFFIALLTGCIWFIIRKIQDKKARVIRQENELSQLQLRALRSQMNPHFVFNSLAAIQFYINENNLEASESYLVKFSKLIRQYFELSKENEIALSTEITLLRNYLELEKLRFKDKLDFIFDIDPNINVDLLCIPAMLLQPIVENAVNHGIFNKRDKGLITVQFINIDSTSFQVHIIDDGVGLKNTKTRQRSKIKSSNVLDDRIHFLNTTSHWKIEYCTKEAYPAQKEVGNISTFIIKTIQND